MELITVLEKFVNLYENNQIPNSITILSTIIPIILSIVVIVQNHIISKRNEALQEKIANDNEKLQRNLSLRNEKLQKDIYNNEIKIKSYDIILNAYSEFINAFSMLPSTKEGLQAIIENSEQNSDILVDLVKERDKIILEYGKLKLLLKEDEILIEKMTELKEKYTYIVNEITDCAVMNKKVEINEILKNIQEYQILLEYDNYHKYFEKYLSFKEM